VTQQVENLDPLLKPWKHVLHDSSSTANFPVSFTFFKLFFRPSQLREYLQQLQQLQQLQRAMDPVCVFFMAFLVFLLPVVEDIYLAAS
jgi:hypothetical protein